MKNRLYSWGSSFRGFHASDDLRILKSNDVYFVFFLLTGNRGNNKITELRAILQRESQNS